MSLDAPNLDDRRFADLFQEARSLIPRYVEEWTDHGDSDPGIALLQLDCALHEMLLYRLNRVPERHYVKFLQLLGIELSPRRPAAVDLTFKMARPDAEFVVVPKGTSVAGPAGEDERPVVFETDRALVALGMQLAELQSFDAFMYSIETKKNAAAGQWFRPFGANAREESALVLGFDSPLKFTNRQIDLAVYLASESKIAAPRECAAEFAALPPPVTLAWEYYTGVTWEPLRLDQDETRAFTQSGHVFLRGPGDKLVKSPLGQVNKPLYWIRCRLVRGSYEASPRIAAIRTNTVGATQAVTVRDEVLGGSEGRPNQSFRLTNQPVLSLSLEIDEGSGFERWTEVVDFSASRPSDRHYVLNPTRAEVLLGDGVQGRIAAANAGNPKANVIARSYRYGGGRIANFAAGAIRDLQSFVEGIDSVVNERDAYGGTDEETVAQAKRRAGLALKNQGRAVTVEDFEALAVETPTVRVLRAKALALTHPNYPGAKVPGAVTVIVVPEGDGPRPSPSETVLRAVCLWLNRARLLTTEVWVAPPKYRTLSVVADVIVESGEDLAVVMGTAEERLSKFLHPISGGANGEGWPFGGTAHYSEIYRVLLDVPGLERIDNNQIELWLDGERMDFCRDVPIGAGELITSEGHEIRVRYATEDPTDA